MTNVLFSVRSESQDAKFNKGYAYPSLSHWVCELPLPFAMEIGSQTPFSDNPVVIFVNQFITSILIHFSLFLSGGHLSLIFKSG